MVVKLDVTDDGSVKDAIESIITEASRIDVLVNNAGYALNGAFEDLAMEELKAQYETNLFGVTRVTQAVLPLMRKQKSGIVVNISSGTVTMGDVVTAKKSQNPNSPYSQIMQKMAASFEPKLENGSSADVVAKVVLKAVTSENPSLMYLGYRIIEGS
jgi:NAD(P)-dependent dehydrogenase (short-subunit alcohol dehydrogenase family)